LAASHHLAAGYVDFAPLIAWLARGSRMIFGESLHAIRLLPALAFAAEIALTGFLTLELGGKKCAVLIACVCVLIAPVILGNGTRLSMNPLEPLFWMGCVYFLLRAVNREKPEYLLGCGILLGIGLENKHSTIFFLTALVLGLLCVSERKLLATKWFWLGAAVAAALALPNGVWQYAHHFPAIEDLRNVKATHKNVELPPLAFIKQQIMMLNPATSLVWVPGFFLLLFQREARRYRSLSIAYIFFLAVMMALKGKDYYLAAIYPMLFAAGGVFLGNKRIAVSDAALDRGRNSSAGAHDGNGVRSIGAADSAAGKNCAIHEGARPGGDANGNEYDRGTSAALC